MQPQSMQSPQLNVQLPVPGGIGSVVVPHQNTVPVNLVPAPAPVVSAADKVKAPGLLLAPPSPEVIQRRHTIWLSAVSLAVTVVLSVIFIMMFVNRDIRQAQTVGDHFVAAIQAKKPDDAYGLTTPRFKETTSNLQLAQITIQYDQYIGDAKMQPVETNIAKTSTGTHAAVVYISHYQNKTYYMRIVMDKLGDGWQVQSFRLSQQKLDAEISES